MSRPLPAKERASQASGLWPSRLLGLAVVAISLLLLSISLGNPVWDPFELEASDLARRVAVQVFGAENLAQKGDPAGVTLTDLAGGELGYTSMALSIRLFGLNEYALRLPHVLVSVAGAWALAWLVLRLVGRREALWTLLILCTLPLYALQPTAAFGDAMLLGGFALAMAGLGLALFDSSPRIRLVGALFALVGLLCGSVSRGLLLGVTAPCVGAGLSVLLAGRSPAPRLRRTLCWGLLALGACAAALSYHKLEELDLTGGPVSRVLGVALFDPTPGASTFDRLLRQLGHAAFPWSILLPLVLSRSLRRTDLPAGSAAVPGSVALGRLALASFLVGTACTALLVPHAGNLPLVSVAALAPLIAMSLSHQRGEAPAAALFSLLLGVVLWIDLDRVPDRLLASFATVLGSMPATTEDAARSYLSLGAGVSLPVLFFALSSAHPNQPLPSVVVFLRDELRLGRQALTASRARVIAAFEGNLLFFLVVFEAGLVGLAAMLFIGQKSGWTAIARLPDSLGRAAAMAWWALPIAVVLFAVGYRIVGRVVILIAAKTGLGPNGLLQLSFACWGGMLILGFFPHLAHEVSPRKTLVAFRAHARGGEELSLLGVSPSAATFYLQAPANVYGDAVSAFGWLGADVEARRFLALRSSHLPELNSQWRASYRENVPIVSVFGSDHLLASNWLERGQNENPLQEWVTGEIPPIERPLQIRFQDHIEALGYAIVDASGKPVDELRILTPYKLRLYFRVLDRIGDWQIFVHVDGRVRHNQDHDPLRSVYPTPLWQPGDVLIDESDLSLPPSFAGGDVWLSFGFFQGKSRLVVSEGPHQDNRARAGKWHVR